MLRHEHFSIAVLSSCGIANDYGLLMRTVTYLARFSRSQVVILLAGRGYFESNGRTISLAPGDLVESDQRRQEAEGYAGSPCELIVLEWDRDGTFDHDVSGEARLSRIAPSHLASLRRHVAALHTAVGERWVIGLLEQLRALGLRLPRQIDLGAIAGSPQPLVRAYGALGEALSHLDTQPNLIEIADTLGLSQRQANRILGTLERAYAHPFDGWRSFVHEGRIEWALQLLSIPGMPLARVAHLAGYRSSVALCHAFSLRGSDTPRVLARRLAEHWG